MDVELVLPGHRNIVEDCRKRITELKEHHQQRLDEILSILNRIGAGTAFEIASQMSWDLVADSWDDYPLMQKWFATGEGLAHIRHLEDEGKVKRSEDKGLIIFSLI